MSWIIALALAIPGFAALCLSVPKHQRQVFGSSAKANRIRTYRITGAAFISLASLWCVVAFGWSYGLVVLFGVLTLAAVLVILMLALRPSYVRYLCWMPYAPTNKDHG
ncbi:MAG: DUF3325 domain-containing protein [Pseudomonadota bacterium]